MASFVYVQESEHAAARLTEGALVSAAVALGAAEVGGALWDGERALIAQAAGVRPLMAPEAARKVLRAGGDPLGEAFCRLRSSLVRRQDGAVYTPSDLVRPMVAWAIAQVPRRVVDAGSGSGRFTFEVACRSRDVEIVAVDYDPLATLMTRAALAVAGHDRARVLNCDYTQLQLPPTTGRTAFIGNPPYVRHHQLPQKAKAWAQLAARRAGHSISGLAGLHAYFYLATALMGQPGDVGCFVTSSEWLDVNYGAVVRDLLLNGLGGVAIHMLEPAELPFEATTTAAIGCFRVGEQPATLRLRSVKRIEDVAPLDGGLPVARERLAEASRWSPFFRTRVAAPDGYVELGELCRVHRGSVTGSNATWVTRPGCADLPADVLFPSVTRARELFAAGDHLSSVVGLRLVIDIPPDLDIFDPADRKRIERFLRRAKRAGAAAGYIATHRRAWWSVGLRDPAPVLATYMARRPPAFVENPVSARHINIAHGLYPRVAIPGHALSRLAQALRSSITVAQGRTYAGGLTKFEPKEMERLLVPDLPVLLAQ